MARPIGTQNLRRRSDREVQRLTKDEDAIVTAIDRLANPDEARLKDQRAEQGVERASGFDALGVREKELMWIEESNQWFYAYNHFGQHPERLLDWFAKPM